MLMYLVSFVCACVEPLNVSEGWLQYDTMVQIQIHPTKQQPISVQHKGPLKLSFQQQQQDDSGRLLDVQPMRVKVGEGGKCNTPTILVTIHFWLRKIQRCLSLSILYECIICHPKYSACKHYSNHVTVM